MIVAADGTWIKTKRPAPLSRQGAIARAAYRTLQGYYPEHLAKYAEIYRVDDFELTAELMHELALIDQELREQDG